ncbi:MAG: MAPEG family protein [Pseudomonadota bacterium]|nr:MAPEG family protein [Pseudomonadota bacterium]
MTVPFTSVAVAFALLFLSKVPVGMAQAKQPEGYNNRHPRDQQAKLSGWGRRALAAHLNGFESFPAFACAVLVSHVGQADPQWSALLAVAHVVARTGYIGAYIADIHLLRTTLWAIGTGCTFALFVLPAFA